MERLISVFAMAILFFFVSHSFGAEFYASKTSNKYHTQKCKLVKRIKPARLIIFENPEAAVKAGYIPCKYCKPPLPSESKEAGIKEKEEENDKKWLQKGYMLSSSGNYEDAVNAFSKGIEINPEDASAYYNRGLAYAKTGRQEQAIEDFKKALELNPRYTMAYTNRGVVYLGMKNYEKAAEDFNSAIEIDPQHYWAYYNKACLYSITNRVGEACSWLEKAIEKGYKDWDQIKLDADLNGIRSAECYKKLIPERQ
jgi:Flp pilus assembly protein TadD